MPLQILRVWAKGPAAGNELNAVNGALQTAAAILNPIGLNIWGEVNRDEDGPLPNLMGYTEEQDYVDADAANAKELARMRDLYLDASGLLAKPVYVLFIVPAGEIKGANGFSLRGGYCSVLPVPNGKRGTADGHTYAHEIGHGLSLPHVESALNLMFPYRIRDDVLTGDALEEAQFGAMARFVKAKHPSLVSQ